MTTTARQTAGLNQIPAPRTATTGHDDLVDHHDGPDPTVRTRAADRALAVLRVATGFVFLWAFLDKLLGLHYSTVSAKAWINGGSPSGGFLDAVKVGPLQGLFHDMANTWWADTLFMGGLLAIGLALVLGAAVRPAAAGGVLLVSFMWLATFPPAQHAGTALTKSTNPLVDDHVLEALILVVLALTCAGTTWGLGRRWARTTFVTNHAWAL